MIFGIGCDIVKVKRFEKWVTNSFIERFFNKKEFILGRASVQRKCEYYAARFAAKEAFSKALGTGISGFSLSEVYVQENEAGKPFLITEGKAKDLMDKRCGPGAKVHISLSHEKEYAIAFVIIEV